MLQRIGGAITKDGKESKQRRQGRWIEGKPEEKRIQSVSTLVRPMPFPRTVWSNKLSAPLRLSALHERRIEVALRVATTPPSHRPSGYHTHT